VAHGDGPGAHWAAGVAAGDVVEGIGPRGKVLVDPEAAWHLFVGDESFTPATFSMVEALTPATQATVILEVGGVDDELPLDAVACPGGPRWLHRMQSPGEPSAVVLDAVRAVELPVGPGFAYLGGEFHTVAAVRDLLVERGLDKEQISAKPYWRAHMANASHGEPVKE
jgi:NADPH-dependent ferric siderophore reductase